ncbi:AhpC/TSA family protein [Dyadobacter jejuensis]|uniref:AhpC/TSA family protein n=1 Tax=Dyadobacter jejuensis TaxID=1082580 RepID=A0A316AHJ2_9BACT|nr:BT_3928 family protein [Dyadobacter jejuensis]PWJ56758.1 AhpC/TSA family protein [Dyadobacter jejuensis]
MKILAQISRVIVSLLFIFSGLIKLNDPVGTQYKLEEYFEVFAADLPPFHDLFMAMVPFALYFSVFLCVAEVVLGIALLLGYKPKTTSWLLLLIILFFTFLTFYSAYFNKVTDCGCFGAAIKLTPWTSFGKDLFLLVLIIIIVLYRSKFKALPTGMLVMLATVGSLGVAFYALRHLPLIDLLPYRVGASIPEQMKPSEAFRYQYIFEKNGETFKYEQYPSDTTLTYKDMVVLNPEAAPKITDYRVWKGDIDFTEESFQGKKLFVILKNFTDINTAALPGIQKLITELGSSDVQPIILSSGSSDRIESFIEQHQLNAPYYFVDGTVLKTISRSNPGLWLLEDGVVKGKWHYNDTPTAQDVLTLVR